MLASGPPPPPPTDQELSARGLGFPVRRTESFDAYGSTDNLASPASPPRPQPRHISSVTPPAIVAGELGMHMEALLQRATPQRQCGGSGSSNRASGGSGAEYVPPTPPNEILVAVAINKAAEMRKQQRSASTSGGGTAKLQSPLLLHHEQLLPGGGGGALDDIKVRNSSESLLIQEPLTGNLDAVVSPSASAAQLQLHSQGPPPPVSKNGYSIGSSLPQGVTWRYVDVLNKPTV